MDYHKLFEDRIGSLHIEGRYRVFADLKRRCGAYPQAEQRRTALPARSRCGAPTTIWA